MEDMGWNGYTAQDGNGNAVQDGNGNAVQDGNWYTAQGYEVYGGNYSDLCPPDSGSGDRR